MQVVGDTAGSHFRYQLRGAIEKPLFIHAGLPAIRDTEQHVRLRFVVQVQAHGSVIAYSDTGRRGYVYNKPTVQSRMLATMTFITHRGRHIHHSFNQLGFFHLGHRLIATLKLRARQPVAILKRWGFLRG
jgi:hypothetical protein